MSFPSVRSLVSVALAAGASALQAQKTELPLKHAPWPTTPAITPADLMTRLYVFADDSMMGREVGTPNHLRATAYIERELRRIGLKPGGDSGTFFQNIPVFDHPLAAGNTLTVAGLGGALYSLNRYEQDRKSQNSLKKARANYFSRDYFIRDGKRYQRRLVTKNGQRYYQFVRA